MSNMIRSQCLISHIGRWLRLPNISAIHDTRLRQLMTFIDCVCCTRGRNCESGAVVHVRVAAVVTARGSSVCSTLALSLNQLQQTIHATCIRNRPTCLQQFANSHTTAKLMQVTMTLVQHIDREGQVNTSLAGLVQTRQTCTVYTSLIHCSIGCHSSV